MRRGGPRWGRLAGTLVPAWLAACALLPERYAVNAPFGNLVWGAGRDAPGADTVRRRLHVPEGWSVGLWARDLPNARLLRFTDAGDLLVTQPREGRVTLVRRDAGGDGRADGADPLLQGLDRPHGIDLHAGWLWVAEQGAIGRVRFDAAARAVRGPYERVVRGLPTGGNHWTRTLRIGPDERLYVSIGSSCNVCIEDDPRRAAIVRWALDGSQEEIYARGLRNAVGFDWRPATGELYATCNGRDYLGDDFPPDELNRIVEGGFYGWPYVNGFGVPDPDYGDAPGAAAARARAIPPVHGFVAHGAALGITFVRGAHVPAAYRGAALVAQHGSWNRTKKVGYRVVSLQFEPDGTITERPFLWGFEEDEDVIGRPVAVAEGPDGAFYVSDDYGGAIWRVAWGEGARGVQSAVAAPAARPPDEPLAGIPAAERQEAVARGRALWRTLACARCHEAEAAPPGVPAPRLADLAARWDVPRLAEFLAAPTPPMPAVERSEADRRDLAVYLLATHP